jgi:hypothetical protein
MLKVSVASTSRCSRLGRSASSLEQTIYVWTRSERWQLVKGSAPAPGGSELWFKSVLRDPEWLRDPAGKSRVEAQKILDELAAQRRRKKGPRADC